MGAERFIIPGVGLLLVILGLLAGRFPGLINPYSSLPDERKSQVDVKGLSSFTRNCVVAMGVLLIAGFYVLRSIGLGEYLGVLITVTVIPLCIVLLAGSRKYYK